MAPSRGGTETASGEQQIQGRGGAGTGGQSLGAAGGGNHSQMQLGHRKDGVGGGDADVGQQHKLQAGADAVAVRRRHDGFGQVNQLAPNIPLPAHAAGDGLGRGGAEFGQVGAGAESRPLPGNQQGADFVVQGGGVEGFGEVVAHRHRVGVAPAGAVEGQVGHAVARLFVADGGKGSGHSRREQSGGGEGESRFARQSSVSHA